MAWRFMEKSEFKIGDTVKKVTGDYFFMGIVVASFTKLDGKIRVVVENPDGILHIFSEANLNKV